MSRVITVRVRTAGRLILAVLFLVVLGGCTPTAQPTSPPLAGIDELQKEKLSLEVDQLRAQRRFFILDKSVTITGGILGAVAILWTITQGYRTLRQQIDSHKAMRIADLLASLSDEREEVRIGAARGLSRYANNVVDEVLSALSIEKLASVRGVLEDLLFRTDKKKWHQIVEANQETLAKRAYLLGRLANLNVDDEFAGALLKLSPFASNLITKVYKFEFDQGRNYQAYETKRTALLSRSEAHENVTIVTSANFTTNIADSTANTIARLLRSGRRMSKITDPVDLGRTNLSGADIRRFSFQNSLLSGCLMKRTKLDLTKLTGADLSDSNLSEASLNEADLSEACLQSSHLRSVTGRRAKFRNARLELAVLSDGQFDECNFEDIIGSDAKFRNTSLRSATFTRGILNRAEFHQADLTGVDLTGCKCYKCAFIEADLTNAKLVDVFLGDADLRGAIFHNADLRGANLSGANISNADFRGARLDGIILSKVKNIQTAQFDDEVEFAEMISDTLSNQ